MYGGMGAACHIVPLHFHAMPEVRSVVSVALIKQFPCSYTIYPRNKLCA